MLDGADQGQVQRRLRKPAVHHAPECGFELLPAVVFAAFRTPVWPGHKVLIFGQLQAVPVHAEELVEVAAPSGDFNWALQPQISIGRSEERRVGKECRSRW